LPPAAIAAAVFSSVLLHDKYNTHLGLEANSHRLMKPANACFAFSSYEIAKNNKILEAISGETQSMARSPKLVM